MNWNVVLDFIVAVAPILAIAIMLSSVIDYCTLKSMKKKCDNQEYKKNEVK